MAKRQFKSYSDDTCKLVVKRYDASKKYCQPYFDRFLDNYKHYFMRIIDEAIESNSAAYPFYSNLMLPISYQTVETILPRIFSKLPSFSITTDEENDENDEMALRELIKYQLQHPHLVDDPVFGRLVDFAKEWLITGNAWGEVPWIYEEAEIHEQQPYNFQMGLEPSWDNIPTIEKYGAEVQWKAAKTKKVVIDAPVFHHRSIFHVFPEPKRRSVKELGWIVYEDFLSKEELERMIAVSPDKYDEKALTILKEMKPWGSKASDTNYDEEIASIFGSNNTNDMNKEDMLYKVLFMREKNKFCIVVNDSLTIREGANPNGDGKLGFFLCKDIPVPNQLFAWGEIDPIKKIEDAMSDQRNMANDASFYALLKMWKLDPAALIDGEEFYPEPGAIVQMNDLNGLAEVSMGSVDASAYKEYETWDTILQAATGVTDYSTGESSPGMTDTKGGIELLQNAANARFMMKLKLFEEMALKAMGNMYVQRNRLFFADSVSVNTEKGKVMISPDAVRRIRGIVHFVIDTGSTESVSRKTEMDKWQLINGMIAKDEAPFNNLTQEAKDYAGRRFLYAMGETQPEKLLEREQAVAPVGPDGQPVLGPDGQPVVGPDGQPMPPDLEAAMAGLDKLNTQPNAQPNQGTNAGIPPAK